MEKYMEIEILCVTKSRVFCLFCCCSADLKDEEEDVNDVDIEGQGSIDVLLWADGQLPIPDEELSVVH